jgi:hypothetical protein
MNKGFHKSVKRKRKKTRNKKGKGKGEKRGGQEPKPNKRLNKGQDISK